MASETWQFQSAEGRDNAKEFLGMKHPSNKMQWLDEFTLKLEDPHYQVGIFLKGHKAKKIDG